MSSKEIKNKMLFARIKEADYSLLKTICHIRGESVSTFVRRAVSEDLAIFSKQKDGKIKAIQTIISKHGDAI